MIKLQLLYSIKISRFHVQFLQCDDQATQKFLLLTEAYNTLTDDNLRTLYRQRNPSHGLYRQEYDWNLPDCAKYSSGQTREWTSTQGRLLKPWPGLFGNLLTVPRGVFGYFYWILTTSMSYLWILKYMY